MKELIAGIGGFTLAIVLLNTLMDFRVIECKFVREPAIERAPDVLLVPTDRPDFNRRARPAPPINLSH